MGDNKLVGMLFMGMAIGTYIPALPEPLSMIQPYLGLLFLVVAVILFVKG